MSQKIIVIGGVAGGATAAARLRRLDENAEIILFEKGEYVSFANCGLPYYIGGSIQNRSALFVSDIPTIQARYRIDIRNFSEVVKIIPDKKLVEVKNLKTGKNYTESYDTLIVSTGSTPFIPPIEGAEQNHVFTLWNVPDTDRVYEFMEKNHPKKAVVVGAGFIGLEMAENLRDKGLEVSVVEFADQVLPPLDTDMAMIVENHLYEKGISLYLGTALQKIDKNKTLFLSNGKELEADLVMLSAGIRPNTKILEEAGIQLNARKGVIVDEKLCTSNKNIYAVGDIIEVNGAGGEKTMIPLAGPANKQGRMVADILLGKTDSTYKRSLGTSILKVFDLTVAATGENEKALQRKGLARWKDYGVALIHPMSHAGYYPGALPMTLKLLFSMEDGKVLGAQIVGYDGVDKRIDTIATTLHFKGNIYDLTEMDLAYAPPFSSAKDPINMAGYVASNILEGLSTPIGYDEYLKEEEKYTLIDTREALESEAGNVKNSINIPLSRFRDEIENLDINKEYVIHCAVGLRGYIAERILKQKGYQARNLMGGYRSMMIAMQYEDNRKNPPKLSQGSEKKNDKEEDRGMKQVKSNTKTYSLDVCGLCCPGPIVSVSKKMAEVEVGDVLEIRATDPGFAKDIESWCHNMGHKLMDQKNEKGTYMAKIVKGNAEQREMVSSSCSIVREKTMIVFDGDLDKAIAAFIIATGSAAMGNKVNMFFTFWGLNILRKNRKVKVKKDFFGTMFGMMMPRGTKKLGLSKMNFMGAGSMMIRHIMKKKGVSSLEELIQQAIDAGVKMVACQMSMDVMGITKKELIDGVEVGGVATMLADNDRSNMNLFI